MSDPLETHPDHLRDWAANPKVVGFPKPTGLPSFGSKRFKNVEEFNAWKESYLKEIARAGGVKWTR